jgi:hypothetical protein
MPGTPTYRSADATVSAYDAAAVTPSNSTVLRPTRALYAGSGGTIKVDMALGTTITFSNVLAGTILPVQVTKVYLSDTDATGIVALY